MPVTRLLLDEEGEELALAQGWDTAIPLSFTRLEGEGTTVTVFPCVSAVGEAFLSRYADDPTADEALAFIFAELGPRLREWGYADDRFRDRWGYVLRRSPASTCSIPRGISAVRLTEADEEKNRTTYDIAATCAFGCLSYGVRVPGAGVVSLAATHEPFDSAAPPARIEVGVETAPAYRRRGYAAASLDALATALCACGTTVEYRCQRYNRASRRTALQAGFRQVGVYYYYVGRRILSYGI